VKEVCGAYFAGFAIFLWEFWAKIYLIRKETGGKIV
jgi:hypothetical protein